MPQNGEEKKKKNVAHAPPPVEGEKAHAPPPTHL